LNQQLVLAFDSPRSTAPPVSLATERRVVVANQILVYRLHRVRRRSIGFQVNERGLTIRAPRSVALKEIEAAIVQNQRWILAKQTEWNAWCERLRESAIRFVEGGVVRYLGMPMTLRLGSPVANVDNDSREIHLALPKGAPETDVRQALHAWLQTQAQEIIGERVACFADRIPQRFAGWRLSSARTQWGSCSRAGRVRLNWRLVHFALPVVDYVIAHELAHLRELNHSPRFWKEVARLLPDYAAARDQIRRIEIAAISF
jgi:predicted metal-dependent hydrolase